MPSRYRYRNQWQLVYSLNQHGISMNTLYAQNLAYCDKHFEGMTAQCPSLLIIRDQSGAVFGAFASEMWRSSSGTLRELSIGSGGVESRMIDKALMVGSSRKRSFYGTGEWYATPMSDILTVAFCLTWTRQQAPYISIHGRAKTTTLCLARVIFWPWAEGLSLCGSY
jgi:hypothetical protein